MKQVLLILTFLLGCLSFSFGQGGVDSIKVRKGFGGYHFYHGNKSLNSSELTKVLKHDEQAYKEIKAAQPTIVIATIIGAAGGALVGWPIGTAIGGGDPNWTLAAIGAGLIVVSIPISIKYNKQAKHAVDTYNEGLNAKAFWDKTEIRFALTGNGVGLTLGF